MKVIFVKNRNGGPFTIRELDGKYSIVCLDGFNEYSDSGIETENDCIALLKKDFGEDNIEIKGYDNLSDAAWGLYTYLIKPTLAKYTLHIKFKLTGILGFGLDEDDYSKTYGYKYSVYNFQIAFLRISIWRVKLN